LPKVRQKGENGTNGGRGPRNVRVYYGKKATERAREKRTALNGTISVGAGGRGEVYSVVGGKRRRERKGGVVGQTTGPASETRAGRTPCKPGSREEGNVGEDTTGRPIPLKNVPTGVLRGTWDRDLGGTGHDSSEALTVSTGGIEA